MSEDAVQEQALSERFRDLYEANQEALAAYALRRCATPEDAADLVSDTFAVAWRRIRQVPPGREATLWLFGTARRVLANQRRSERRRRRLALRLQRQPRQVAPAPAERAGELEVVKEALERLPATQRDMLGLVAWEGLSIAELARVLGCSENAAKIRLHRARGALLAELQRMQAPEHSKPASAAGHELGALQSACPMPGETR